MIESLRWLFSSENFMPHGHCFLWQPGTLWLNVGSDALIAGSYFSIPGALYYFIRQRESEIRFAWVAMMFAAFIFLCGGTHIMEIWTVWNPIYRVAGALKLLTGFVSFATLLSLVWIMPRAMLLQTPLQLEAQVHARTLELVEVNAQLRAEIAAREAAERQLRVADRRKDEFLATLAHELRNPLAPIRNSLALLQAPGVDESRRLWSRTVISRQVQRMALLLDDLLDVSRITRNRLELRKEPVELHSLIASAVETASPLIESKSHALKLDLPQQAITVEVDPLRMSQAIANLLSNAAKYTSNGGQIHLTVQQQAAMLVIVVADNGIGFHADEIPTMFEMFAQVAAPGANAEAGLGIGLALVKGLVTLHGGSVQAASSGPGLGAEFTIHLPDSIVAVTTGDSALAPPAVAGQGPSHCKVLIADDNRDSADSLAMVLSLEGYEVLVAYSAEQALEVAQQELPDAMILDIGMPDMSGYEVARRVRQQSWGREAFLAAMTGWGQAADKDRAMAAGFDRHLTKPIDPDELQRLLGDVARRSRDA